MALQAFFTIESNFFKSENHATSVHTRNFWFSVKLRMGKVDGFTGACVAGEAAPAGPRGEPPLRIANGAASFPGPCRPGGMRLYSPHLQIPMPKISLNASEVKSMLLAVADQIIANEPYLSEADRNLGDGDHGVGMQRGFNAVKEKLAGANPADGIDKLFGAAGMAMISTMGGASGAIFGTLFRDGGKALAGRTELDAAGYAAFLRAACDGVTSRGKAKPGDKTMVDALHPATEKAAEVVSLCVSEAMAAVAAAGEAGRDASTAMIATLGRARTLGEASIGFPDAGACSVAIILRAMSDFAARQAFPSCI